jgi:tRNA (guanine-N7-)-methyltransferase
MPAPDPNEQPPMRRGVRSYVLRAGRMGPGQQRAIETLGPRFVLPVSDDTAAFDFERIFGRQAPVVMEIGFGMGDATAQIAKAHPEIDFLGVEVHEPGVGALLKRIGDEQIGNIRIVQHDAVPVLQRLIAPDSLAGVHLFFPDPWPKKRHHKRRLLQPPLVALIASRLRAGGVLHAATDWQDYAEQMLTVLAAEPLLRNTVAEGFAPRPAMRPLTKFEQRGLRLGHAVWDVVFERV